MTGPPATRRTLAMAKAYRAGASLAEVGRLYGVSRQRVHQVVKTHAVNDMRVPHVYKFPSVGPLGAKIYAVGVCRGCEATLCSYRPEPRELCGHCEGKT